MKFKHLKVGDLIFFGGTNEWWLLLRSDDETHRDRIIWFGVSLSRNDVMAVFAGPPDKEVHIGTKVYRDGKLTVGLPSKPW